MTEKLVALGKQLDELEREYRAEFARCFELVGSKRDSDPKTWVLKAKYKIPVVEGGELLQTATAIYRRIA